MIYASVGGLAGGAWLSLGDGPARTLAAAGLLLLAGELARRGRPGLASAALGAGVVLAMIGIALRDVPLAGAVMAALMGAVLSRGLWGERELRRQLRHSEQATSELSRTLRHALRLGTAGDLAGMAAHQLRNQLQLIDGDAVLGQMDPPDGKDRRFTAIRDTVSRAAALVGEMLDLVHPADGAPVQLDLVEHIRGFGERLRGLLPDSVALRVELYPTPVPVLIDPRALDHALLNLVINAKQAMPNGGELCLGVRADGGLASVSVRDTGCGIDPGLATRVFEPYVTTKPKGQGTGLGLAAVRRFAESVGGRVQLESRPGHGATFRLEFPLRRSPAVRETAS